MRNPLGQIKYSLDTIGHTLPAPTTSTSAQAFPAQKLSTLYQHLAQGQIAVKRGLQVISMTLDEVSAKPIDVANFVYLSAAKTTQKAVDEYSFETEGERSKVSVVVVSDFTFKGNETSYIFVLFNLIKNALYYFKQQPTATLTLTIDQSSVTVKDTGPGIPEHVLAKLFKAFSTSGKSDGTGLGLAYCQRAMQAFGGSITCTSVLGEHTTFTLNFVPIAQAELDIRQAQFLQCVQPLFSGKHILVVDDSAPQRATTRHMLQDMNCQIDEAENGQLALSKLQKTYYDLIIMDLNMPVLDGYATTEQIRAGVVPGAKFVPIVAYTSESAYMASVKTQKVGMNGFVSKPCSQIELIEVLQQALEQAEHQPKVESAVDVLAGKTILIADDVDINRQIVASYVQPWGMKVVEACNGMEVIDLLIDQGIKIDIALMDMQMPGLSGIETTRAIREEPRYQHLPILALTGNFGEQSIQAAYAAGMNDFISKPFEVETLREKLSQQLVTSKAAPSGHLDALSQTVGTNTASTTLEPAVTSQTQAPTSAQDQAESAPESASVFALKKVRSYPVLKELVLVDLPLLNLKRLDDFKERSPDMLLEMWPDYLQDLSKLQDGLRTAIEKQDFEEMHRLLHSLTGNCGNAGAFAMHQFIVHRIYPDVDAGHWPREEHWLETIADLRVRTEVEMRQYLAQVTVPNGSTGI